MTPQDQPPEGWFDIDSLPPDLRLAVKTQDITYGCDWGGRARSDSTPPPLPMPVFYDVSGRWRPVGGDTLALFLEYHVIGDAEFTGEGYPPYRIVERIAVDTMEITTSKDDDGSRRYVCSGVPRVYVSKSEQEEDTGMYVNESEFLRLASVADSILATR